MRPSCARQIWINGTQAPCNHSRFEVVLSNAGDPICEICSLCGQRIAEWAPCAGCRMDRVRTTRAGKRGLRFCGDRCEAKWAAEGRAAKKRGAA